MARPVTLCTGQWADLPLEDLARKCGAFGFDGLGGVGCGWANALVMWYQLLAMIGVVSFSRMRATGASLSPLTSDSNEDFPEPLAPESDVC